MELIVKRTKELSALAVLVSLFVLFVVHCGFSQQVIPEEESLKSQKEKSQEIIVPSPKNIKEKTAIYVFLGWMWLLILVLIYFLRLKIKEVDRLLLLKFFSNEKNIDHDR